MSTSRPKVSKDMIREAARPVAESIDGDLDSIVGQYTHSMDGYELARELERYCGWEVSRSHMEELDDIVDRVNALLLEAEKKWVKEHSIRPPHPIGAITVLGEITSVPDRYPACYLVKELGQVDSECGNRRQVVRFEDVILVEATDE